MRRAAPGALTDQPREPQAPPGANAGAAGEPVLSNAAASTAGVHHHQITHNWRHFFLQS